MDLRPAGYSYSYKFKAVGLGDIRSGRKFFTLREGERIFIFEMRTEFFIKWGSEMTVLRGAARETIGSERFDIAPYFCLVNEFDRTSLICAFSSRLMDYWMSEDEVNMFYNQVRAFAMQLADQHADVNRIPIAVKFKICTVQQEGESMMDTMNRAIMPHKLSPLYLWEHQSMTRKALGYELNDFLFSLSKTRVDSDKTALALMPICTICARDPQIGDQITKLSPCACAFHYPCIVVKLEMSNHCPKCNAQVYDSGWLKKGSADFIYGDI